jgi:hypothetical protein
MVTCGIGILRFDRQYSLIEVNNGNMQWRKLTSAQPHHCSASAAGVKGLARPMKAVGLGAAS